LERAGAELDHTLARLRTLSPAATLDRGYAIVHRADGAVVRKPADVAEGDPLRIRLAGGDLAATAEGQA
jgi:exodeoxyribonuclease VII large subunit